MDKIPEITVLMSVHNGQAYISQAIESILGQTFQDFEFLIINDASTDKTPQIIKSYREPRIKVINNQINLGLTKSLNIGLKQAQGQYIARLDADDISLLERLEKQYRFLENHPEIVLIGSWAEIINEAGQVIWRKKKPIDFELIKFELVCVHNFANPLIHSSIFFRKKEILALGGYNEDYQAAQDFELYSRLMRKYKMANLPEVLIQHRAHSQSIWRRCSPERRKMLEENVSKIIYNNINYYLSLSQQDFKIFNDALNQRIKSWKNLIRSRRIYQDLFESFIRKEEYSPSQIKKILSNYQKKRKQMFRWYLKNRFPCIYNLVKSLYESITS